MKPHLCIDARMLFFSGIGSYLQNLIPRLYRDFFITFLTSKEKPADLDLAIIMDASIYTVKEQFLYPLLIPSCDLFWSPHYNVPLFPIKAKKQAVTIHDLCPIAHPDFFPKKKRLAAFFVLCRAVKQSDIVITVSEFSKKEIVKFLPIKQEKVHVILNGSCKKNIQGDSGFFLQDRPFFLYVGTDKPHKNLDRMIRAFVSLRLDCDIILVGPMNLEKYSQYSRVRLLGMVPESFLTFLYQKALALIQPSLYEGFGLTPLEAMEQGCPVICSSYASLPEVCGDAALYIDPLSEESIAKGMFAVFHSQELRLQLIQKGYIRAQQFSWDRAAQNLSKLFLQQIFS